ncbi:hypothetical protein Tco_0487858 [Tanacetum coccineum]
MASINTRLNIEKHDENIVQKHGGSKQVGFKQLGPDVETEVHGVHDEKRVWFDVELQEAQGNREAERSTQQCMKSGVAKHLGVAGIQQQNRLVDETNMTLFAKLARDREQYLACELFRYREDSNEDASATVAGNAVTTAMAITGSIHHDSQRKKLVQTLLEGHFILSLEDSLSGVVMRKRMCQPRNQNFYEPNLFYNSNYSGFDQTPQYSIDHQPQSIQEDLNQQRMNDECIKSHNDMIESRNELLKTMQSLGEMLLEHAANLSTHTPEPSRRFNSICDDDEESTIPLNEIISQLPPSIAITPVLSTMEPEDSLIMGDENLSTILEKESDKFIKSSVEDLIPIPRESDDTSDSDKECDLPFSMTFSNPLLDANDDFTSSNDESLPKEDHLEENFKIYSNPLFEFDEEYISSDVNPLFNEVLEDIESKESYVSNLDESALLVTPLSDANKDECFDPGGDINEIDAFLDIDVSTDIEDGYHDSEGDVIYLECFLTNDTIHNLPHEVFLDHDPRSLKDEPDNDDLKSMVKVFDPGIHEKIISLTYARLPFEDRHYFSLTFVIRIFLPYLTYSMDSSLLLSSGSEDTIFDPDIFVFSFYSLELVVSLQSGTFMCFNVYLNILNESPMGIFSSTCFVPNITMIWGESS